MAENKNTSKLSHTIPNSTVIASGSPTLYQLRPKRQEFGTMTRLTVGEKNVNKTNRTVLLVGETGAGKSGLINALVNYTMGVTFEDEDWFQLVEDEKKGQAGSQTVSQTSDVMVYEIFGFEGQTLPYSLTIIDTPGFGDTRGIEHDVNTNQRLFDLFRSEDGVHELHAIGLVMKASDNRLSDRLSYVFDSVMSLFGKNVEKNIVALITHSNGRNPKNALQALEAANVKCSRNQKNQPVYFLFNNCQHEDRAEEPECLKNAAQISERGMRGFTDFLERIAVRKMEKTVEVLNERINLTASIQNLQERIELIEIKQTEIRHTQQALKRHQQEMKKNENFTFHVDEVYKDKEPLSRGKWGLFYAGAVCCTDCEENCHYPCTMARTPKYCEVMKRGRCTVCTNKCPPSAHVREKWIYVAKTRRAVKTETLLKLKYESNKREGQKKLSLLENLESEIKQLGAEKSQLLDESYQHVVRLEQIALNVTSLSTFVHLDFLIEKMKERGDTGKLQKLQEMKSRENEGTRSALVYMMSKLKLAEKTDK
ncbi:uncharacterized protein LOC114444610 isoform X2 [Parambassis ranga]|uniref:Uncharacterized protein LOC114444610 isoform X2 n=1 Tax=Parambassis ranga TaxID=210632 RepID=A0A6P7JEH3_9TELE|nr:uncharacterized protein LOC114444610 isoform X2 [Parambassis ranga]